MRPRIVVFLSTLERLDETIENSAGADNETTHGDIPFSGKTITDSENYSARANDETTHVGDPFLGTKASGLVNAHISSTVDAALATE